MGVVSALIRVYLSVFIWFVSDRPHARAEHRLILWSIEDNYLRARRDGHSPGRALVAAVVSHLPELTPLAVFRKTLTDQASAPDAPGHPRIGNIATVGIVMGVLMGLVLSARAGVFSPAEGLDFVAEAQPSGATAIGTPKTSGPYDNESDALAAIGADPARLNPGTLRGDGYGGQVAATADAKRAEPKLNCVVRVAPLASGDTVSAVATPLCFDSLDAAVFEAVGSTASFALGAQVDTLVAALSRSNGPRAIGVSFAAPRYLKGGVIIWVAENDAGCATGLSYAAAVMPAGWDDVISSAIALGGCGTFTHYDLPKFSGARIDCTCGAMVAMDGLTSSVRWTR